MSNEELSNVIDRAEDEYQKLKDKVIEQSLEIERLNKGYCKFKEECGKYATCLRENQLKEIERLNNIINKVYKYLDEKKDVPEWWDTDFMICMDILKGGTGNLIDILKGSDKE